MFFTDDHPKYYKGVVEKLYLDSFHVKFEDGEFRKIQKSSKWCLLA